MMSMTTSRAFGRVGVGLDLQNLSGTTTSCCGAPGTWSVATYFAYSSAELFDWGMTLFKLDMRLTDEFSASTKIAICPGTFTEPTLELTFSWTARW